MSSQISDDAAITREGPISAVSVPAGIGVGTELVHSLDYVVMLQVMFDVAANIKTTPLLIWERLKTRGIRSSKNANELVGRNSVYESFARLVGAGYLRRVELPNEKHPGRKGPIAYRLYDNPAWNPDWQAAQVGTDPLRSGDEPSVKPQVGTLPGTPEAASGEVEVSAGQNASRNAGSGVQGCGVPGRGERAVSAGQNTSGVPGRGSASPPHPPEEEEGTSSSVGSSAAAPRRGRPPRDPAPGDVPAQAAATAAEWLRSLPGKWAVGLQRSESLAPYLVANAAATDWELGVPLRLYLTRTETGKRPIDDHGRVLAYRIKNMQRREAVIEAAAAEDTPDTETPGSTVPAAPEWCGECDSPSYRWVIPDHGPASRCPRCGPAAAGAGKGARS